MNAALLVKKSNNDWEVIEKYSLPAEMYDNFIKIYQSSNPIVGMPTEGHINEAFTGATWNGSYFSGGVKPVWMTDDLDMDPFRTYVLLSDNLVFMTLSSIVNTVNQEKLDAAFASEVTLVPILPGQEAKIGNIWNGSEFLESL
jgi:hypothetical protein